MKLKQNDEVIVISGNAKGSTGRIKKILKDKGRVIVSGINIQKKHVKPSRDYPQGGRIEAEGSLPISNVMPLDPETGKATRLRIKKLENGKSVRVTLSGQEYGEAY